MELDQDLKNSLRKSHEEMRISRVEKSKEYFKNQWQNNNPEFHKRVELYYSGKPLGDLALFGDGPNPWWAPGVIHLLDGENAFDYYYVAIGGMIQAGDTPQSLKETKLKVNIIERKNL